MEELIQRIVAKTGLDPDTAQKSAVMILNFLKKNTPAGSMDAMIDSIPGGRVAIEQIMATGTGGGGWKAKIGGMMSNMGSMGGIMGLATQLSGLGLDQKQMQQVGRQIFAFAEEHAGPEAVQAIAANIPGASMMFAKKADKPADGA